MASERSGSSSGIGFCGLLAILFIGLKLGNVIQWSWLWVLAPLWMPFCLAVALLLLSATIHALDR